MSSAFDPSKGLAIPEETATENGLELDQDPALGLDIAVEVVSGDAADPAAAAMFLEPQSSPRPDAARAPEESD